MMKRVLLVLLGLAGCSDRSVGPADPARLEIQVDAIVTRELTLAVGTTASLTARLGEVQVEGGRVVWQSSDAAVLGVTPAGLAEARAAGEALVIASSGAYSDTLFATVLATPPSRTCGPTGEPLALEVGSMMTAPAAAVPELCLQGGGEYLAIPFNGASSGTGAALVRLSASGGLGGGGFLPLEQPAAPGGDHLLPPHRIPSAALDRRLRLREERELAPLVVGYGAPRGPFAAFAGAPAPGEVLRLNVNSQRTCSEAVRRSARVTAVTRHAVLLEDQGNPAGGLSPGQYQEIGQLFDELIYPTVVRHFGEPTDIDGNGRVLILFTRAVNELTERSSSSYIGGFFYSRDLFPHRDADGLRGCDTSNVAELLYVMAPDPTGSINGNVRSSSFVTDRVPGILAHELQHLIGSSRRLRVYGHRDWNEEFWLNEGLSHIAEELIFYAASGLQPGSNLAFGTLRETGGAIAAFERYQASNIIRYAAFLRDQGEVSPLVGAEVSTRGASWAFLRYAADRSGVPDEELWRRIIDSQRIGYENLMGAIGSSPSAWMNDWAGAVYADDLLRVEPKLRQPSWNLRSIVPVASPSAGGYPLRVRSLRASGPREVELRIVPGGAEYVRFTARSGDTVALSTSAADGPIGPDIRLNVLRLR